jgi:membrane-associated protein
MAPFIAGASSMPYSRFIGFCISGAALWVSSLIALGYQFGNLAFVKNHFEMVILGIITISVLPVLQQLWVNRSDNSKHN